MTKTQSTLKTFFVSNQVVVITTLLSISGCAHGPIPKWNGDLYPGDSKSASLIHKAVDPVTGAHVIDKTIKATDPEFDDMIAMHYADMRSFVLTYVQGCKQWKKGVPMMSAQEALTRYSILMEDLSNEAKAIQAEELKK